MKLFSHKKRPVHLGPYPLERLPRIADPSGQPTGLTNNPQPRPVEERSVQGSQGCGHAFGLYGELFDTQVHGPVAPAAPIPNDPTELSHNLKAGQYFLDADMVGCGIISDDAWTGESLEHRFAIVTLIAFTPQLDGSHPGDEWIDGTRQANADLRAAELAVITASYIRNLGFDAKAHTPTKSDLDIGRVALQAGLVEIHGGELRAPYLAGGFALSVVSTELEIQPDAPLARRRFADELKTTKGPAWWLGVGGTRAGFGRLNGDHRPLHMGRYPMEKIDRVDEPTTLIIDDEVPRVPVRAGGFPRAAHGDMGPKFQADVKVFAFKTPQAQTYVQQIAAMVPHQDGPVAPKIDQTTLDPAKNADDLKALAYHLGGDMVGVCDVPTYAWYSHKGDGTAIEP
ncbi:MAG: hypothetical protein V3V01_00015, partial [Acidimicrobiales bacterium]